METAFFAFNGHTTLFLLFCMYQNQSHATTDIQSSVAMFSIKVTILQYLFNPTRVTVVYKDGTL